MNTVIFVGLPPSAIACHLSCISEEQQACNQSSPQAIKQLCNTCKLETFRFGAPSCLCILSIVEVGGDRPGIVWNSSPLCQADTTNLAANVSDIANKHSTVTPVRHAYRYPSTWQFVHGILSSSKLKPQSYDRSYAHSRMPTSTARAANCQSRPSLHSVNFSGSPPPM